MATIEYLKYNFFVSQYLMPCILEFYMQFIVRLFEWKSDLFANSQILFKFSWKVQWIYSCQKWKCLSAPLVLFFLAFRCSSRFCFQPFVLSFSPFHFPLVFVYIFFLFRSCLFLFLNHNRFSFSGSLQVRREKLFSIDLVSFSLQI